MGFVRVKGLAGKVWVPETGGTAQQRKHPCPDCHCCQHCSDDRCQVCTQERKDVPAKGEDFPKGKASVFRKRPCRSQEAQTTEN